MDSLKFFSVDAFICLVVAVSFIVGWARGATKEILAVVSWIGGGYLAISLFPYAKDITRSYIAHKLIADFVTACILFIVFLTILSVVNYFCSNFVKKSMLNTTDKALGGIFGIIRGVVILSILELILNQFYSVEGNQQWLENSRLRPFVTNISNFIILILPNDIQEKIISHMSQLEKQSLVNFLEKDILGKNSNIDLDNDSNSFFAENANKPALDDYEEFIEDDESQPSKNQTAEDLAMLKPKKVVVEKKEKDISKKERNDMDRILDQYDNMDEQP